MRFTDSRGRILDFHKGRPGQAGWRGIDHWHDPRYFGPRHLLPGCEVPDPAPLPTPQRSAPGGMGPTWLERLLNSAKPVYPLFIIEPEKMLSPLDPKPSA
jgi:hypothetical protein